MLEDPIKRESLFHYACLISKVGGKYTYGINKESNKRLSEDLSRYGTFENVFYSNHPKGLISDPIYEVKNIERVAKELERINFESVNKNDPTFPRLLRREDTPPVLYFQGDYNMLNFPTLAFIGTRRLNSGDEIYGENLMNRILNSDRAMSCTRGFGYTIISGLALGSDTIAHRVTLQNSARTVAVIGTPLNQKYPIENSDLQDQIAEQGLLISQYPIGFRPYKGTGFIQRNWTVANLSDNVVVLKSDDRSGTKHVMNHTQELGIPLFVSSLNVGQGYRWLNQLNYRVIK